MSQRRVDLLEDELSLFPIREGGNALHAHFRAFCRSIDDARKAELLDSLRSWLETRSEPRTMLALTMVEELCLRELRLEVVALLKDIEQGRAFWQHYAAQVQDVVRVLTDGSSAANGSS